MKLFVATHNQHKIREIGQILPGFEIVADDPDGVEENAPDFIGNAFIKVRAIAAKHRGAWCLADDSGLEVAALGGEPGVRSARYSEGKEELVLSLRSGKDSASPLREELVASQTSGEGAASPLTRTQMNNALLLKNLAGVTDRRANFTCAIALVDPHGGEHSAVGKCFGRIAEAPSGAEGFGYDPLFVPDGHDKSFAELSAEEKNAISHRGRALAEAVKVLKA